MKKLFLFAIVASLLSLVACSSSDDENESVSVKGKTFATYKYSFTLFGETTHSYTVWRFISDSELEQTTRRIETNSIIGDSEKGTYTLNYPNMTVTVDGTIYNCLFTNETTFSYTSSDNKIHEFTPWKY